MDAMLQESLLKAILAELKELNKMIKSVTLNGQVMQTIKGPI